MNQNKLCGMIGLAKRAGALITGAPLVCEAVRGKTPPKIVLLASDAAENSCKRVANCCAYYHVGCVKIDVTTEALAHAIGKRGFVSAVAIADENFAAAIKELINITETCVSLSSERNDH